MHPTFRSAALSRQATRLPKAATTGHIDDAINWVIGKKAES
jgi:hypothetical protein